MSYVQKALSVAGKALTVTILAYCAVGTVIAVTAFVYDVVTGGSIPTFDEVYE